MNAHSRKPIANRGADNSNEEISSNLFYREVFRRQFDIKPKDIPSPIKPSSPDLHEVEETIIPPVVEPDVPYLQCTMFASAFEDCIKQLRLLAEFNNELRISKTMAEMDHLRAKKYQIEEVENKDPLSKVNPKKLDCMQYKINKLVADRTYITDLLLETYLELALEGCYTSLAASNKETEANAAYRDIVLEEEAKNKACRRELIKQLRLQRRHVKSIVYDTDIVVDQLKSRVEDAAINAEIRSRYIDNWERSRTEQNNRTILENQNGAAGIIAYYQSRTEEEQRVHTEIELLVNIFVTETLNKVEDWMNKYDEDIEKMDFKIAVIKHKYQDTVDKRTSIQKTFGEHEKQINNWIQFKKDRHDDLMYKEKMNKSAITVQAWWRGLLVRLELGPYKKSRKSRRNSGRRTK